MIKNIIKITRQFSSKSPKFVDPTIEESFGTKFSDEQVKKIMDPKGFLDPDQYQDYEGVESIGGKKTKIKDTQDGLTQHKPVENDREFGFKVKGPEPTRFGDWERKGRISDF